jgi:hypothetical protein
MIARVAFHATFGEVQMSYTDDDAFVAWGGGNYDYLAVGPANFGFVTITNGNDPNFNVGVSAGGHRLGVVGYAGPLADDGATSGPPQNDYSSNAGVLGSSLQFTGVAGTTDGLQPGVYGQCGDAGDLPLHLQAGVLGVSQRVTGVWGRSSENVGVSGQSMTDYGVWGTSIRNTGVVGQTGGGFGPRFTDPNNPGGGDVRTTPVGVLGTTRESFGVAGTSFKASGVLGQSGAAPAFDSKSNYAGGVIGTSRDAPGIIGVSQNGSAVVGQIGAAGPAVPAAPAAVLGTSDLRPGVIGTSRNAPGIIGVSQNGSAVVGQIGAAGPAVPAAPAAVLGTSDLRPGVIGTSNNLPGVMGISTNQVGIYGQSAKSYSGYFAGDVFVAKTITASVKNAVVPFPDGSQRLLHCMESPEHWFEDFGSAKLKSGRVTIQLDRDFAKVVKLGGYHVFLTPEGDCQGLYVRSKRGKVFEVREMQGGTSNVKFSYRIVGKRKDIKAHQRFEKVNKSLMIPVGPRRPSLSRIRLIPS